MDQGSHFTNHSGIAVKTAGAAATLRAVQQTAWGISLAAINAKILTAQAGHQAAGFKPITDYIGEIARFSMEHVDAINRESLTVSRASVQAMRSFMALSRFQAATRKAKSANFVSSIFPYLKKIEDQLDAHKATFATQLSLLRRMLGDIRNQMKAANAVASLCRVEAASAGDYRKSLEVVADNLAQSVEFIEKKINESDVDLKTSAESL